MKSNIDEIKEALKVLEIGPQASLCQIRKKYKELLFQWHPDRCNDNKKLCNEKTRRINAAYKVLLSYCENYLFSFEEEALQNNVGSDSATKFWYERFGDDPIWS